MALFACTWLQSVEQVFTAARLIAPIGKLTGRTMVETQSIVEWVQRDCHIAVRRAPSNGGSEIVRLLQLRSATWSSPQREGRGAFGLK